VITFAPALQQRSLRKGGIVVTPNDKSFFELETRKKSENKFGD